MHCATLIYNTAFSDPLLSVYQGSYYFNANQDRHVAHVLDRYSLNKESDAQVSASSKDIPAWCMYMIVVCRLKTIPVDFTKQAEEGCIEL